jgi:hypothetical protein
MSHAASLFSPAALTADAIPAAHTTITAADDPAADVPVDRQAAFVRSLSQWGNVQAAARQVGVSRAHLYRMRRASAQFRNLWDAALVLARPQVEEVLADRALNGVQETVFYHGEEVATRTRYDSRLLLAHLARLDRIAASAGVAATVRDFDEEVERLLDPEPLYDWDDVEGDWDAEAEEEAYDADGYDAEADADGDDEDADGEGCDADTEDADGDGEDRDGEDGDAEDGDAGDGAHDGAAPPDQCPAGAAPAGHATPAGSGGVTHQSGADSAGAQGRVGAGWGGAFSRPGSGGGCGAGFDSLDSVSCVSNSHGAGGSLGG